MEVVFMEVLVRCIVLPDKALNTSSHSEEFHRTWRSWSWKGCAGVKAHFSTQNKLCICLPLSSYPKQNLCARVLLALPIVYLKSWCGGCCHEVAAIGWPLTCDRHGCFCGSKAFECFPIPESLQKSPHAIFLKTLNPKHQTLLYISEICLLHCILFLLSKFQQIHTISPGRLPNPAKQMTSIH